MDLSSSLLILLITDATSSIQVRPKGVDFILLVINGSILGRVSVKFSRYEGAGSSLFLFIKCVHQINVH